MCGIVGRINRDWDKPVADAQLQAATAAIRHRGPDGEGFFVDHHAGLGHRRLAIVDIRGGKQPLSNEDGTVWVSFNGEIYNHQDLRQQLIAKGHVFVTQSDTEVLAHGYEEWGKSLPTKLRGMFAFAIYDRRRRSALIARDRLGIKPLYWTRIGQDLAFASEIKALFAFDDLPRREDEARLPEYFALRYVPGPATMFEGIYRLQPGHRLFFEDGRLEIEPYWDVPVRTEGTSGANEEELAQQFLEAFTSAVKMRLMGEVPVGLFLSGGIDSTAVGWAMKQFNPGGLKSFSVGFEGTKGDDELSFARLAAEALGTEHREVVIDSQTFLRSIDELAWHLDEPLSDGACIPLMCLSKRARQEVVVVLSGEGADEILGGYGIYGKMLAMEQIRDLGGRWVDPACGLAHRIVPQPKIKKYLSWLQKPLEGRYFGVGRGFGDDLLAEIFGRPCLDDLTTRFASVWAKSTGSPTLNRMLYTDTKVWLPDDLLVKADKMSMAHSIELRVPFLDHPLLERSWALPASMKRRGGVGKYLLRRAMSGKIPEAILQRPKRGFPVPIRDWLKGKLYEPCRDQLLGTGSAAVSAVGRRIVERLLDEHRRGMVDRTEELYALWVYDSWRKAFFRPRPKNELVPPRGRGLDLNAEASRDEAARVRST